MLNDRLFVNKRFYVEQKSVRLWLRSGMRMYMLIEKSTQSFPSSQGPVNAGVHAYLDGYNRLDHIQSIGRCRWIAHGPKQDWIVQTAKAQPGSRVRRTDENTSAAEADAAS